MIHQAKLLKTALKQSGIVDRFGKTPSCRTERIKVEGGFEYGDAVAITDYALTEEQISKIQSLLPYAQINNYPELNFAAIKN